MACRLDGAKPLSEPVRVNWTHRNKIQWNLNPNSNTFIQQNVFENVVSKMAAILSRPQCVKWKYICLMVTLSLGLSWGRVHSPIPGPAMRSVISITSTVLILPSD